MKLLQAIVTSSVETLDGRQGIGLVECSRSMPDSIKKQAGDWGSPSNGNREPVYSYRLIEDAGTTWAVMNCTVPATDYTGRTSHVSHTIALGIEELRKWFRLHLGEVITPCEFMLSFPWKNSWNGTPQWIEGAEDVDSAGMLAVRSEELPPFDWHPAAALLAFEFEGIKTPKPKRLAWKSSNLTSEAMLRLFHSAWLALDPWRGRRNYGDHLGEPSSSLMDSWECSWTTDLRDDRPDDYQWIVFTPGTSNLGPREVIDVTEWKALDEGAIARLLGASGELLVARSTAPDEWAQEEICKQVDELRLSQSAASESLRSELNPVTESICSEAERVYLENIKNSPKWETYLKSIDTAEAITAHKSIIEDLKARFDSAIGEIESKALSHHRIQNEKIKSLLALRTPTGDPKFSNEKEFSYPIIQEYRDRFHSLEGKLLPTLLYVASTSIAHKMADKAINLEAQVATLNKDLKVKTDANERILKSYSASALSGTKTGASGQRIRRSGSYSSPWLTVTLAALVLGLGITVILNYRNESKPKQMVSNGDDELKRQQKENGSQKEDINKLTNDLAKSQKSEGEATNKSRELEKSNSELKGKLEKKTEELDKMRTSQNEKPATPHDGGGGGSASKGKNEVPSPTVPPTKPSASDPPSGSEQKPSPWERDKSKEGPSSGAEKKERS